MPYTYEHLRNEPSILNSFKSRENISLTCNYCHGSYDKTKHQIQSKLKHTLNNYCSIRCFGDSNKNSLTTNCKHCTKVFPSVRYRQKDKEFCSTSCSSLFRGPRTLEEKEKISKSLKASPLRFIPQNAGKKKARYIAFSCPICNVPTEKLLSKNRKTCGEPACIKQYRQNFSNLGGYRKGSVKSKHGYFQEHYCDSTYELVWVMYNLEHNILFNRFEGFIPYKNKEGVYRRYYPDFLQDNKIIEIKGYHTELVDIKTQAAKEAGYDISVLYKQDIQYMFDWFEEKYPGKHLADMYENKSL